MAKKTKTSSFGTTRREGHDSSSFYKRNIYSHLIIPEIPLERRVKLDVPLDWRDKIHCRSAENLPIPDESVALAFTSPPYNVGKDYDDDMSLSEYFSLIRNVGKEVYRVLKPGGRYVINVANLGRKPYIPLHSHFYSIHQEIGFLTMGEIIWQKAQGSNGNCAWGSWRSAKAPRLRDIHEYLLVFSKQEFSRPDIGKSEISSEEFMESTLSVWRIAPESARKVGHPAPFPIALAERVIKLYSYLDDVILDPFVGSGTTCVAASKQGRHYVGVDISRNYCDLAQARLHQLANPPVESPRRKKHAHR